MLHEFMSDRVDRVWKVSEHRVLLKALVKHHSANGWILVNLPSTRRYPDNDRFSAHDHFIVLPLFAYYGLFQRDNPTCAKTRTQFHCFTVFNGFKLGRNILWPNDFGCSQVWSPVLPQSCHKLELLQLGKTWESPYLQAKLRQSKLFGFCLLLQLEGDWPNEHGGLTSIWGHNGDT